jgi:hypothetical protein
MVHANSRRSLNTWMRAARRAVQPPGYHQHDHLPVIARNDDPPDDSPAFFAPQESWRCVEGASPVWPHRQYLSMNQSLDDAAGSLRRIPSSFSRDFESTSGAPSGLATLWPRPYGPGARSLTTPGFLYFENPVPGRVLRRKRRSCEIAERPTSSTRRKHISKSRTCAANTAPRRACLCQAHVRRSIASPGHDTRTPTANCKPAASRSTGRPRLSS